MAMGEGRWGERKNDGKDKKKGNGTQQITGLEVT